MTAAALLVVLGAALIMQLSGLSMAMGAFLAGVLLSESTFRHQLEIDIEPFRGILLGAFFLGVGMSLDLAVHRTQLAADPRRRAGLHARQVGGHLHRRAAVPAVTARRSIAPCCWRRAVSSPSCSMPRRLASACSTPHQDRDPHRHGGHLDGADAARRVRAALAAARRGAVHGRRRHRRGSARQRARHRLRPLRPGGEPVAVGARLRRLDHRHRHRDDPRRRRLRLQGLLRRRLPARCPADRGRR